MAKQSLIIKDGSGATKTLEVDSGSFGFVPYHYISSSQTNPVFISGNVRPGADGKTLDDGKVALLVYISGNLSEPLPITSSQTYPAFVTNSVSYPLSIIAQSGLSVTSSVSNPVYVSSSYSTPVVTKEKLPTTLTVTFFNAGPGNPIDWASTASVNVSGTFIIAQSSSARSGLMFTNNFQNNIYVVFDSGYHTNNGFGSLNGTASAPSFFSFILFPSGTYTADPAFVNLKHSGFIVSASNISSNTQLSVYSTE